MRKTALLAAAGSLVLAGAAHAQAPSAPASGTPPAAASSAPQAQSATPQIKKVDVIDMTELPEATQTQVNALVAKTGEAEIANLRKSVDAVPQAKQALQAKGAEASHVVAARMSPDGTLTLVTKKPS